MCEVTRGNFKAVYDKICQDVRHATFIAFDAEFTGLRKSEKEKPSLFDDGFRRYQKIRESVSVFLPCQIGITAFIKDSSSNVYHASSYNFMLYPHTFGPVNRIFMCEASALEFLARYNFDFNKFVYEGITYMNNEQEKLLRQHVSENSVGIDCKNEDKENLQECCSLVADWLTSAKDGDVFEVPGPPCVSMHVVLTELRNRFPQAWANVDEDGQIVVKKMEEAERQKIAQATECQVQDDVIEQNLGFTQVFREIIDSKKPIVGHNCFTDLLMMYERFYEPLPDNYLLFKEKFSNLFPVVYDTKHIVNTIRRDMEQYGLCQSTSLSGLHSSLESVRARNFALCSPHVKMAEGFDQYNEAHLHEAGYDSFICGQVFLKLSHILVLRNKSAQQQRNHEFYEYLTTLKIFKNKINIIRGSVDYIRLDGDDPPSRRPQYIYVQPRKNNGTFSAPMIAQQFSPYGCVDVQMNGSTSALVAVGNHGAARDILRKFKKDKIIFVCKYSVWKHSPVFRGVLWSCVLLTGGFCAWSLLGFPKPKILH